MFDPSSISAALTSAKAVLDLLKNAGDAQLAIRISSEIANVRGKLIDVEQQALALQDENRSLRDEIRTLKDSAQARRTIEAQLAPEDNAYFREVDGGRTGPYCTACWDDANKLVRLTFSQSAKSGAYMRFFHVCALHPDHPVPMSKDYSKVIP